MMTQAVQHGWIEQAMAALNGEGRRALIQFLQRQRWFRGKGKPLADARLSDAIDLLCDATPRLLAIVSVEYRGGEQEQYAMPLAVRPRLGRDDAGALVELSEFSAQEWVCDGTGDSETWTGLYAIMAQGRELSGRIGCMMCRVMPQEREELAKPIQQATLLSAEQSNTSVIFDRRVILKLIRQLDAGVNPDSEVLEFLTTHTTCRDVPAVLGVMTYDDGHEDEAQPATVAVLQRFVPNDGDGWSYTLAHLEFLLGEGRKAGTSRDGGTEKLIVETAGPYLAQARRLGEITGGLHVALSSNRDLDAFRPEPITDRDCERWGSGMRQHLSHVCRELRTLRQEQAVSAGLTGDEAGELETSCWNRFEDLQILSRGRTEKIRHHGDFHLGQVLKTTDGFVVIDFEGEPARPLEERRAKVCPLKDVGGMLRSFNYAVHAALKLQRAVSATDMAVVTEWEGAVRGSFLDGYRSVAKPGEAVFLPATWEEALQIVRVYELDKALYELRYEMRNRPDWLPIPLMGIQRLMRESAA